ncbi:MAG: hypothetical protein LAP40_02630 [Acidobacteriia bacterium]|nr:hypothetical protein [Terriglobia bacterium]
MRKTTRRDIFKFAAGSAAGLVFTPAPWRLITDTALWSENWPGIPRPARGQTRTRFTHCALCSAGCAVRARCVNDQPVSLSGLAGSPLCAFGLAGHQLPYHTGRVKTGAIEEALAAIAQRRSHDAVAVLDLRPGRTASWTYRRAMAALPRGFYLAAQSAIPAVNLDQVRTLLSFGAPVLDGWGTPSTVLAARSHFRLIQAEPLESHTAMLADLWLPLRKGSEQALALGIAHVLMQEQNAGASFPAEATAYSPARTAQLTGLPEAQIVSVARELAPGGALVLASQEWPEILQLNRLLGSVAHTIVGRRETPVPASWKKAAPVTAIEAVPDGSIGVLLIDESVCDGYLPWNAIEPKLAPAPLVVTFASSRAGYGRYARFTLPTAVYPEMTDDIPPALDSAAATFRLATPLVAAPAGAVEPARFIAQLAGLPPADALRERTDAIQSSGRGVLRTYADGKSIPVKGVKPDDFWKVLNEGGCWVDAPDPVEPPASACQSSSAAVVAMTWEMRLARGPMSPLLSKLYEESNLRVRL